MGWQPLCLRAGTCSSDEIGPACTRSTVVGSLTPCPFLIGLNSFNQKILPPFGYKLDITSGKVFGSNLRICFASCFFRTERGRVCWGSVRVNALDWPRALTHRTRETAVCMPVCMPHARICPLACFPFLLIRPTVSFLPYFFLSILLYTQHYSAPFLLHFFASSSSLSCAYGIHRYGR